MGLVVLGIAGADLTLHATGDGPKDAGETPAVKNVRDQAEAVREARKVDLPLLEKADNVIFEEAEAVRGRRYVMLDKAEDIK